MTKTEYLKTLMVSRLGTGDDESAEIINNMVDSATTTAAVYETDLDADLGDYFYDNTSLYQWDFNTPTGLPLEQGRIYKITFNNDESKTIYEYCTFGSAYGGSLGDYNNPHPIYVLEEINSSERTRWTIFLHKSYVDDELGGTIPKHITITTSYIKEDLVATFVASETAQPLLVSINYDALYEAVQNGTPYKVYLDVLGARLEMQVAIMSRYLSMFYGMFDTGSLSGVAVVGYDPSDEPNRFTLRLFQLTPLQLG